VVKRESRVIHDNYGCKRKFVSSTVSPTAGWNTREWWELRLSDLVITTFISQRLSLQTMEMMFSPTQHLIGRTMCSRMRLRSVWLFDLARGVLAGIVEEVIFLLA